VLLGQHLVGEVLPVDAKRPQAESLQGRSRPPGLHLAGAVGWFRDDHATTDSQKRRSTLGRYRRPAEASSYHKIEAATQGRIAPYPLCATPHYSDALTQTQRRDRLIQELRATEIGIEENNFEV
jgi:hypothetical protein